MRQLRYAVEDIFGNKGRHAVLFIQAAVALLVFSFTVSLALDAADYRNRLLSLTGESEIYLTRDLTDPEYFQRRILAGPDAETRLAALYRFMSQSPDFDAWTADSQHLLWLPDDEQVNRSFAVNSHGPVKGYGLLRVDANFLSVFGVKCVLGTSFTDEHFTAEQEDVPLILGHDFRFTYEIGDVITDTSGTRYRVVGVLGPSSSYLDPSKTGQMLALDRWFVTPIRLATVSDYDSAVNSTFIITNDPTVPNRIQDRSTELGLYTFEFRSFSHQLRIIQAEQELQLELIVVVLFILLTFSTIGMISNLVQFVATHGREFAVHLLSGGRIRDIVYRVMIQALLHVAAADVIVLAIHGLSLVTAITVTFSLLAAVLTVTYPVLQLSTTSVNTLLRRAD